MIKNIPDYAKDYKYIVARRVDGEFWFYDAWNDSYKANTVARELKSYGNDAVVFNMEG